MIDVSPNGAMQSYLGKSCELIPAKALLHVAGVMHEASCIYPEDNWRGLTLKDHLNHAIAHVYEYLSGDRSEDHLGHAATRLLMAVEKTYELPTVQTGSPEYVPEAGPSPEECIGSF